MKLYYPNCLDMWYLQSCSPLYKTKHICQRWNRSASERAICCKLQVTTNDSIINENENMETFFDGGLPTYERLETSLVCPMTVDVQLYFF